MNGTDAEADVVMGGIRPFMNDPRQAAQRCMGIKRILTPGYAT